MTPDLLVVGGGIVGLTVALEAKRRDPSARVLLVEKEEALGRHASGRNSGVLHAGFYYDADSLKARFSREGTRRMTEYCLERGLPLNRCGKLVVARGPGDLPGLAELKRRGDRNGVLVEEVDAEEARRIDPTVRTFERALFSPTTASVDPVRVMASLEEEARGRGVEIRTRTRFLGVRGGEVVTTRGTLSPGYVVNAAGLQADRIARAYGFGRGLTILPFKGLYLCGDPPPEPRPRVHVYPVPELSRPFLGVHFTLGPGGEVKIGPTAVPAFWREHYGGLAKFRPGEAVAILLREAGLFLRNDFGFRSLAVAEIRKHFRRELVSQAARLVQGVPMETFRRWGRPGIRAQLYDIRRRSLVMDFRVEGDDRSLHVLNAVSPAFTCAFPFAEFVLDEVERLRG